MIYTREQLESKPLKGEGGLFEIAKGFGIKLFDLKLEGAIENNGELPAKTKDMYTQIDELHILIEDIHQ